MRRANVYISILLMSFSCFYAYLTMTLPTRKIPHTLGIDFMPWVLTICLLFLSLLLLLKSLIFKREEEVVQISLKEVIGILSLVILVIAYIEAWLYFGFVIITPLFMAGLIVISGSRKWREVIFFSIIISVAVYFLFYRLFGVPLPSGKIF